MARTWDKVVVGAMAFSVLLGLLVLAAVLLARPWVATLLVLTGVAVAFAGLAWAWPRLFRRQGPRGS